MTIKLVPKFNLLALRSLIGLLVLCALLSPSFAQDQAHEHINLRILRGETQIATLKVEVAQTLEQKMHGLMFRKDMPALHGMLFAYAPAEKARMWMKNTFIPLDMLFIDDNQEIIYIHHNAEPHSLTPIGPDALTSAVIEINGGEAETADIRVGDHIQLENPTTESAEDENKS